MERSESRNYSLECRRALRADRVATTCISYVRGRTRVKSPAQQAGLTFVTASCGRPQPSSMRISGAAASLDAMDAGDVSLASAQDQPASVQEV